MKSNLAQNQAKANDAKTHGRPRLLTHEEILEGAVELGLEGLTMKKLATHLNVGTATLYQYYDSRKSLMRAAAVYSLADVPFPVDTGQHWSELGQAYAESLATILAENPSFIYSHQHTDYGFEVHFRMLEPFLTSMQSRGFSPSEGMKVFNIIGMAAFGGAIETVRQREFEFQDETMADVARRQFDRLNPDEYPLMKQALPTFVSTPQQKIESLLSAAFKSVARERGEDEGEVTLS